MINCRTALIKVVVLFGSTILSLTACEVALRIVTNQWFSSPVKFTARDGLVTARPASSGNWTSSCFQIDNINMNRSGFRGAEWLPKQKFRVLLFGDSMPQGLQVGESEHVSTILQKLLGAEVLDLSVSGTSTVHQLALFKRFAASLNPDLVILFFFSGNDFLENTQENESLPVSASASAFVSHLKSALAQYCLTCTLTVRLIKHKFFAVKTSRSYELDAYAHKGNAIRERQDLLTSRTLKEFASLVADRKVPFVVVNVPGYVELTTTLLDEVDEEFYHALSIDQYNVSVPRLRAAQLLTKLQVLTIDPFDTLLKYRNDFQLPHPFFSFYCDGHWNPLGHLLAAVEISSRLIEMKLLPTELIRHNFKSLIETILKTSPRELLGQEAFSQIFERGTYRGRSLLPSHIEEHFGTPGPE